MLEPLKYRIGLVLTMEMPENKSVVVITLLSFLL
jgi:hypothetical protein